MGKAGKAPPGRALVGPCHSAWPARRTAWLRPGLHDPTASDLPRSLPAPTRGASRGPRGPGRPKVPASSAWRPGGQASSQQAARLERCLEFTDDRKSRQETQAGGGRVDEEAEKVELAERA